MNRKCLNRPIAALAGLLCGAWLISPAFAIPPAQSLNGNKPLGDPEKIVFETDRTGEWTSVEPTFAPTRSGDTFVEHERFAVPAETATTREKMDTRGHFEVDRPTYKTGMTEDARRSIVRENEQMANEEEMRLRRDGVRYEAAPPTPANELSYPIDGTIQRLMTVEYPGFSEPHVLAEITTEKSANARAELGPKSKIDQLNLRPGDSVYIEGHPGHLNGQPVMVAETLKAKGQTTRINHQRQSSLHFVTGDIQSIRTVRYSDLDQDHVIARVNIPGRGLQTVDLGPSGPLEDLRLSGGDLISLSVYPGRINNDPAMIAWKIEKGQNSVDISRAR